jgi:hypothetical protein
VTEVRAVHVAGLLAALLGSSASAAWPAFAPDSPPDLDPAPEPRRILVSEGRPRITAVLPAKWEFDDLQIAAVLGSMWLYNQDGLAGVQFFRPFPVHSPRTHTRGRFPVDFIGFLRRHPRLRTGRPIAVRIGGVLATLLDVTALSNDPNGQAEFLCTSHPLDEPCLPISHDPFAEGIASVTLYRGMRYRFVYIRTRSWQRIVLVRRPGNPTMDRELRQTFSRVLNSIRFG